jgi:hypothetical protein
MCSIGARTVCHRVMVAGLRAPALFSRIQGYRESVAEPSVAGIGMAPGGSPKASQVDGNLVAASRTESNPTFAFARVNP